MSNIGCKFLTYDRDDVDLATESLHELHVEGLETVARGGDEVEAGVHSGDEQDVDEFEDTKIDGNDGRRECAP